MRISDWSSDVCSSDLEQIDKSGSGNAVGALIHVHRILSGRQIFIEQIIAAEMPGPRANAPFLGGIVRRERTPKAQAVADAPGILNRDYALAVDHRPGGRELATDVEQERCIAGQDEGAFADTRYIRTREI